MLAFLRFSPTTHPPEKFPSKEKLKSSRKKEADVRNTNFCVEADPPPVLCVFVHRL